MNFLKPGVAFTLYAVLTTLVVIIYNVYPFDNLHGDVEYYYKVSLQWLGVQENVSKLEYPLLATLPLMFPHLLGIIRDDFDTYKLIFLLENALLLSVVVYLSYRELKRLRYRDIMLRLTLLVVIALPCQVLFLRMDMFPATLTFLAFLAFLHQRYVWAGVFLMLSVGTKLYPIVLIPVFGVVLLVWWNWKAIGKFTLGLLIPLVCILIVWKGILQKEPMGLVSFLSPHSERGIQIESIAASGVYLYSFYKDLDLKVKFSYGADHLVFQYTDAILQVLIGIFVLSKLVLIMMTGVVFRSVPQQTDRQSATLLATYVTAALMLFILANKVFSPQYLVWILPFVCFLKRRIQLGFVAIFTLSSVLFPFLYVEIAKLNMPEQGWLIFRNFLFLLVFAALFFSASYRKKKVA